MLNIPRFGKMWWLQLGLAFLIVCIGQGILIERAEISGVVQASRLAAQVHNDARPVIIDRPPARFIKDSNPSFSAVAVDSDHNMLVVADENLFQILEYDPRENTPPQARLTEPKRIISGTNTKAEMMCG